MNLKLALLLPLSLVVIAGSASAVTIDTIYFKDDFESGPGKWSLGTGLIQAGHGGSYLEFANTASGGDAATASFLQPVITTPNATTIYISFDYSGTGGFLGINPGSDNWLAGGFYNGVLYSGTFGTVTQLTYDSVWRRYEVSIPGDSTFLPAKLMLENFGGVSPGGIAKFDNIVVANYSGARIPDGGATVALLGMAMGGLVFIRRKLS